MIDLILIAEKFQFVVPKRLHQNLKSLFSWLTILNDTDSNNTRYYTGNIPAVVGISGVVGATVVGSAVVSTVVVGSLTSTNQTKCNKLCGHRGCGLHGMPRPVH